MNICNKKDLFWIPGKLYQGNTSKYIYLCLDNGLITALATGRTYPQDISNLAYTECTDQYCLQRVK